MFAPIIMGSDKNTVSVATGQNDFYPLYASVGNVQNHICHAHCNALSIIGFLAIPKTDKQHQDSVEFCKFCHQLFHSSVAQILMSVRPWTTKPCITQCGDGQYQRIVYGLGSYIADYPEQALLVCVVSDWCGKCTARPPNLDHDPTSSLRSHEHTEALHKAFGDDLKILWEGYGIVGDIMPFTSYFPWADIHELLAPDLLHQIIKGTFKDNLVMWVGEYLESTHGPAHASHIMADIDQRIAAVPSFPGLQRFPEGRGFKKWTGDDSKALMKVYLPAISGHVSPQMVRAINTLAQIDSVVEKFHQERQIFIQLGICEDFSLPQQHSLVHYQYLIQQFGAPNESKHIKAVKEPWRRSNRNALLGQMLLTNQCLNKLAASRVDFEARGMLTGSLFHTTLLPPPALPPAISSEVQDAADVEGITSLGDVVLAKQPARNYPKTLQDLSNHLQLPSLPEHIQQFLYDQFYPDSEEIGMDVDLSLCPTILPSLRITVFHSALSTYFAPSDLSGIGGMHCERIWATPYWKNGPGRYDFKLLFSFTFQGEKYSCALVHWFTTYGNALCQDTGMWCVQPDKYANGQQVMSVVHLDTILRGAHLIGVAGDHSIPKTLSHSDSLDAFHLFYVNKYADHHAHEIAF
ncbi:hypothetical protein BDZ94DRAFT_1344180 [Collybia nuda]|uniref:Uncharacterized protein n=1 Tax=Collybia nuda TaxID=64659 RepID=A0A9P6C9B0_9AGAR|nr:hypothetical protein BDZ94DRAFT_1344180 [Collybia nuda]